MEKFPTKNGKMVYAFFPIPRLDLYQFSRKIVFFKQYTANIYSIYLTSPPFTYTLFRALTGCPYCSSILCLGPPINFREYCPILYFDLDPLIDTQGKAWVRNSDLKCVLESEKFSKLPFSDLISLSIFLAL